MKYEIFLRLLMTFKKSEENSRKWYDFGVDLHECKYPIAPYLYELMIAGFEAVYDKDGIEWIDWFVFENDYGQKDWSTAPRLNEDNELIESEHNHGAEDSDGNPIAYSYESLYELLESKHKQKETI